jgi:phosphate starvation-inducible protein PhoH
VPGTRTRRKVELARRPVTSAKASAYTDTRMQDVLTIPNEVAAELAGVSDSVLEALRERLACTIRLRGNRLTLDGDKAEVAQARTVI